MWLSACFWSALSQLQQLLISCVCPLPSTGRKLLFLKKRGTASLQWKLRLYPAISVLLQILHQSSEGYTVLPSQVLSRSILPCLLATKRQREQCPSGSKDKCCPRWVFYGLLTSRLSRSGSSHAASPPGSSQPESLSPSAMSSLVFSWIFLTVLSLFWTDSDSFFCELFGAAAVIFLRDSEYFVYCKLLCSNSCGYTVTQKSPSGAHFHTHPFIWALLLFSAGSFSVTLAWCHTNIADLSLRALSSIDDCLCFLPAWNCFILANPAINFAAFETGWFHCPTFSLGNYKAVPMSTGH